MIKMDIVVRQAGRKDAAQMLEVYNAFVMQFVGSAQRSVNDIRRMMREKDSVNWVALRDQDRIIGYVHAHMEKRMNGGEFREIVIDPELDFERVAELLVEKVNAAFVERKAAAMVAGSVRNPVYEKVFPKMGFFEWESLGVFMYAILDVQRFLNEFSFVLAGRLSRSKAWSGVVQIECEGCSVFLSKSERAVQSVIWTNQPVDFKVSVTRELLTKLVFGVADAVESHQIRQLRVEATEGSDNTEMLLKVLFPKRQFIIMDYW